MKLLHTAFDIACNACFFPTVAKPGTVDVKTSAEKKDGQEISAPAYLAHMEPTINIWESKILIRFPDCDPFNHLNNARYIDYFINAREDHIMANMNFNIYHFAAKHGLGWVVGKNQIVYLKPAFLMETVVIDSTLLRLGAKDLLVEMKMWNETKTKLKSVLWSHFVHINMQTQKPELHSEELMQRFKPLENPLPADTGFDERIEQLRNL